MQQTLPAFNEWGYLPAGIYGCLLAELGVRFGFTPRRQDLLNKLKRFIELARQARALRLLVGGSFVTDKSEPNDIDLILVTPVDFHAESEPARLLLAARVELEVHVFTVREDKVEDFNWWMTFFGHDRSGHPKGLVEVPL